MSQHVVVHGHALAAQLPESEDQLCAIRIRGNRVTHTCAVHSGSHLACPMEFAGPRAAQP